MELKRFKLEYKLAYDNYGSNLGLMWHLYQLSDQTYILVDTYYTKDGALEHMDYLRNQPQAEYYD